MTPGRGPRPEMGVVSDPDYDSFTQHRQRSLLDRRLRRLIQKKRPTPIDLLRLLRRRDGSPPPLLSSSLLVVVREVFSSRRSRILLVLSYLFSTFLLLDPGVPQGPYL